MANPFDVIRKLLAKPSPLSAEDAAAGLAKADAIEISLRAVVAEMAPQAADIMVDESARAKARQAVADTERQLADVATARERLLAARAVALTVEEDARRRAIYDTALATLGKPGVLTKRYETAAREVLASVRAMAEMSLTVAKANAALPASAVPLTDPFEAFALATQGFLRAGQPRKILGEKHVALWCLEGAPRPIANQSQVTVSSNDGRRGYISPNVGRQPSATGVTGNLFVELRTFVEITFLPETNHEWAGTYAQTRLTLPGLYTTPTCAGAPTDAATVIAAIDAASAAALAAETAAPLKRERKVELRPMTADGEILEAI